MRQDVTYTLVSHVGLTYEEAVRVFFAAHVFPVRLEHQGQGIRRNEVVVEKVEREGNNWWLRVRVRYNARIASIAVAERVVGRHKD